MNYILKAIKNIIKEGITDVELYSYFYEIDFLKDEELTNKYLNYYKDLLSDETNFSDMKFKKNDYVLFPKNSFASYRKCALISLSDEIKYLSMVLSISRDIEKARIDKKKNIVFSYRLKLDDPLGYLFDSRYNYQSFRVEMGKIISSNKYGVMIKCDISNFYDRLNIHRLDSKLKSMKINQKTVKKINDLLLYWANRNSYSLPVGSNASRILAEAALIDVDNYLLKNDIKYIRFVDDFRIFAENVVSAQKVLNMLIMRLDQEGLFLNSQKTEFVDLKDEKKNILFCKSTSSNVERTEDERRNLLKIIRGYNGTMPTKFRMLSKSDVEKYKKEEFMKIYDTTLEKNILEANDVIYLIKVLIANEEYDYFLKMDIILKKFPQLIPYYISAYKKIEKYIVDNEKKDEMKRKFLNMLNNPSNYPTFVIIYILRLFENDSKYTSDLFDIYKKLPKNADSYLGRRLLEVMEGNLERYQLLELKELLYKNSEWEQRQILKCLSAGLCEDEFKPILKDFAITGYDELITDKTTTKIQKLLYKNR